MAWFAVRSIYLFAKKSDGTNVFEERIVCFEGESAEVALVKAERESEQYVARNGFAAFPELQGYEQDGDDLIDCYELWSKLFESRETLTEFYANRYTKYDYHPE